MVIMNGRNAFHTADCGVPLMSSNVELNYTSTLEGAVLTFTCKNEMSNISITNETIFNVTCHSSGNWIPDPAVLIKSCSSAFTGAANKHNYYIGRGADPPPHFSNVHTKSF